MSTPVDPKAAEMWIAGLGMALVEMKDSEIAALRAEVASKNDEFQKYARRMEADMNELGGENTRLTARIRELEGALKQIDIGFVRAKDAPAMHDEAIRIARAALLPSKSGKKKGGE